MPYKTGDKVIFIKLENSKIEEIIVIFIITIDTIGENNFRNSSVLNKNLLKSVINTKYVHIEKTKILKKILYNSFSLFLTKKINIF